jgi:hypothetical protein
LGQQFALHPQPEIEVVIGEHHENITLLVLGGVRFHVDAGCSTAGFGDDDPKA